MMPKLFHHGLMPQLFQPQLFHQGFHKPPRPKLPALALLAALAPPKPPKLPKPPPAAADELALAEASAAAGETDAESRAPKRSAIKAYVAIRLMLVRCFPPTNADHRS